MSWTRVAPATGNVTAENNKATFTLLEYRHPGADEVKLERLSIYKSETSAWINPFKMTRIPRE